MKSKISLFSLIFVTVVIIVIYLFLCVGNYLYPLKYKQSIIKYSAEYNVDAYLVASIINVESRFDENSVSNAGAVGLMQLMPETAKWVAEKLKINYTKQMLFNADYNIKLGTYYFSYLKNKFKNLTTALIAYNAGEGTVMTWLKTSAYSDDGVSIKNIPYKETNDYIKKVEKNINRYKNRL